jgi:hypothetical protein
MQSDQITISVPRPLAQAYRSASPEQRRKMDLYMTLRLKAFEAGEDAPFDTVWARLGEEAAVSGLTDDALAQLLREIDDERDAGPRPDSDSSQERSK